MSKTHKDKVLSLRHFIFLEVPFEAVSKEAMLWEQGVWWPKRGGLQFKRLEDGLQEGTRFKVSVRGLLPKSFEVEVARFVPGREIHFLFKKGMLNGVQVLRLEDRSNGTRVDYELSYEIKGPINKMLWGLLYQKTWDTSTALILESLKNYLLKQAKAEQEKGFQ